MFIFKYHNTEKYGYLKVYVDCSAQYYNNYIQPEVFQDYTKIFINTVSFRSTFYDNSALYILKYI